MHLEVDKDVKHVLEFMQNSMPATKLLSVAKAIAELAPVLWGRFEAESIFALRLVSPAPNAARVEHTQQGARAHASAVDADGGFEAVTS
jgi:hypothetical protein